MSEKMESSHSQRRSRLESERFLQIDRQRSLRLVNLAERGYSKRKTNRSHSRFGHNELEGIKNQKQTLIRQIQQKLSLKETLDASATIEVSSNSVLQNRVNRLQKLMENIRRERNQEGVPKTVFIRQPVQSTSMNVTHINQGSESNLHLILKQMYQVIRQIKDVNKANQRLISQIQPRKPSLKVRQEDYQQFKRSNQTNLFARFPPANFRSPSPVTYSPLKPPKPKNIDMFKKDTLISELMMSMPMAPQVQPSQGTIESDEFSHIQRNHEETVFNHQNEMSYPATGLQGWKPRATDPNLHPSKMMSSAPVHRISAQKNRA